MSGMVDMTPDPSDENPPKFLSWIIPVLTATGLIGFLLVH